MNTIEPTLIGLLLRNPGEIARMNLSGEHFLDALCAQAFMVMRRLVADGVTPDTFAVSEAIPGNPGGELLDWWKETAAASPRNLPHLAERIRKAYRGRKLATLLDKARDTLAEGKPADPIRARLLTRLAELDDDDQTWTHSGTGWMHDVLTHLEAAQAATETGQLVGVTSGLSGLDKMLGGFHRSDLIVVGARPKMGKTAWMMSTAHNAAKAGKRVGIISAEMPAYQLGLRLVSIMANLEFSRLRACDLQDHEYSRLTSSAQMITNLPIFLYDKPACTPGDIAIQARAWAIAGGLDLLFVDYLTRLNPDEHTESRTREVGKMVASLKTVARTLDVPVVCLSQLSRRLEERKDKRPMLSDLRDSGEIEQEADVVAFLYREAVYDRNADPANAEIIVEANRHGPPGVVQCRFEPTTMHWMNRYDHD